MKVEKFEVIRGLKGVSINTNLTFDVELQIDIPMHLDFIQGIYISDAEALQGKTTFYQLSITSSNITNTEDAKKAADELRTLLQDLEYRETVELNKLLEVERYLKEHFKDYIEKNGGKNNE